MTINEIYEKLLQDRNKAKEQFTELINEYRAAKDKEEKAEIWEYIITLNERASTLTNVIELLESSGEINDN